MEQLARRNPSYHCNGDNSLSNSSVCSPSGNDADVEDFDIYERIEMGAKYVSMSVRDAEKIPIIFDRCCTVSLYSLFRLTTPEDVDPYLDVNQSYPTMRTP